jgi:hypothetical protein
MKSPAGGHSQTGLNSPSRNLIMPNTALEFKSKSKPASGTTKQTQSFTSDKLDWCNSLMADHQLDARANVVGFCIAQTINQRTGLARLSDETIADKPASQSDGFRERGLRSVSAAGSSGSEQAMRISTRC